MHRHLSLFIVALLLGTSCQILLSTKSAQAQPFTSTGTRYGMNVEGPIRSCDYAFVDLMHTATWSYSGSHDSNGYPSSVAGGRDIYCLVGDPPGLQTYNFYGEGIFTPAFTGAYSTNQKYPYGGGTGVWKGIPGPGICGAILNTVSVLPPNYPGNSTNAYIKVPPNSPGNPNAVPSIPANPLDITLVIPPNSPANPMNKVVTTCQVQYQIPPQSPSGWVYNPTNGVQGTPLSWLSISSVNPQGTPGENPGNFHLTRPGYPAWRSGDFDYPVTASSYPLFTDEYLRSFAPFCCLRFMDWMNTNGNTGLSYGKAGLINSGPYSWANRQQQGVLGDGACYEYMAALCNATNCDMWFNVPIQATADWKSGFATLMVNNLHPWLHCYYEHGNELWNWSFIAWQIVNQWAIADFGPGLGAGWFKHGEEMGKLLMSDISVIQPIFNQVSADFGRPIAAGNFSDPTDYCGGMLSYIQNNYGPPANYIYGMAGAPYFGSLDPTVFTGPDLTVMQANMKMANQYGIKMCAYEAGQSLKGPSSANDSVGLANQESSAMAAQYQSFANMWQQNGGDLCDWFTNSGLWSQFGCWGHLPIGSYINNLSDPACTKYNAAAAVSATCNCGNAAPAVQTPPSSGSTPSSGSGSTSNNNGTSNGNSSSSKASSNNNMYGGQGWLNSPGGVPHMGSGGGGSSSSTNPGGVPWMQ